MMDIKIDMRELQKAVEEIDGQLDQIPFALARSMNDAVKVTRQKLITEVWPAGVQVRNKSFMRASLRTEFASKKNLAVTIYDSLGRGNLTEHVDGGTRTPQRGSALAVPSSAISAKRSGRGIPKALKPRALPNSFRKGDTIYQRTGSYQKGSKSMNGKRAKGVDNRRLTMMYVLKRQTQIKKTVKFREAFEQSMFDEVGKAFTRRFEQAMSTRNR